VSRLYDRVLAEGCSPVTATQVYLTGTTADERHGALLSALTDRLGRPPTAVEVESAARSGAASFGSRASYDVLGAAEVEGAVVVSAEEVARYVAELEGPTKLEDIVDVLVPPFDRLFVEFQRCPNMLDLHAWGILVSAERLSAGEGWKLDAAMVGEWRKGKLTGAMARWKLFLGEDGRARAADADTFWRVPDEVSRERLAQEGGAPTLGTMLISPLDIPGVEESTEYQFLTSLFDYFAPAALAVSLMHCKNIDIRPVDPPIRVSRSYQRKQGRPLTRYYELDIRPMRRVLDTDGEARTKGLGHALHICRGHFKTYGEDAPLFGKHTGTYWWEAQARGKAEQGVVEKDYRIRLDQGLGREYIDADEHPEIRPTAPEHNGIDPDLGGRGLRAHNMTQNLLATVVREAGHEPRRPKPDEPQYDLAWETDDTTWVAEIKSITLQNEERQLRTALGQVLRYRQLLETSGRTVRAMIATEREPDDASWATLCASEQVALVWAPDGLRLD
jgi:hypothetical protein